MDRRGAKMTKEFEKQDKEIINFDHDSHYHQVKSEHHQELVQWIHSAEAELADLYLRKEFLEADFPKLLSEYQRFIVQEETLSTIAKTSLLEYLSYELLKPLEAIGLSQTNQYNTWETSHFMVAYQLTDERALAFHFKIEGIDLRFDIPYMPLLQIDIQKMMVQVDEKEVLELIRLWYAEKAFSQSQLSLINYDLNQLLSHFKTLGFEVAPSFLDNANSLSVHLESELPLETETLDQIFITTMDSSEFDFDCLDKKRYLVSLNQEQKAYISEEDGKTKLFIDSNHRRRSILDFFTAYPFLVPLMVRT